jgi:hypothetical protein
MAATSGDPVSTSPMSRPRPITRFSTGRHPARWSTSSRAQALAGTASAGLKTTVLPASAGAIFHAGIAMGKFHGVITETTPTGSLLTVTSIAGRSESRCSPTFRLTGVELQQLASSDHLAHCIGQRLALLACEEIAQLVLAIQELRPCPVEDLAAAGTRWRPTRPRPRPLPRSGLVGIRRCVVADHVRRLGRVDVRAMLGTGLRSTGYAVGLHHTCSSRKRGTGSAMTAGTGRAGWRTPGSRGPARPDGEQVPTGVVTARRSGSGARRRPRPPPRPRHPAA